MAIPETQTAIVITGAGGPDVLQPQTVEVPVPGSGQVLIRVSAAGVNRHDVHQRSGGRHSDGTAIPGLEVCGTIAAVGAGVDRDRIAERVMALVQGGGYGQYVIASQHLVLPAPDTLSDIEAAGFPEAAFTTWWNFFHLMSLGKEGFALIHGGTSGVGHIALQAMSALGYRVIATAGTEAKVTAAKGFGAHAALSYRDAELAAKVMEATGGQGISALLDVSAGAHLDQDLKMMAPDGQIAHLSGGGGAELALPLRDIMAKRLRITGSLLRPLPLDRKARVAEDIRRDVLPLLGTRVRPTLAATFDFRDAASAHAEMERNDHIGKIMLTVDHD
ncbi:zinc-binding dehydrogenase [Pseudooceanicola sp. 216_PA32_1]|uniref:Zinc-binding dehydrogenase n=1 Tax=Pseudooceanicola pacificus TaxID=2676438 RepID=A0A844WGE9_9RHOB|nr:NAD(P)H-quinone oxidoreductase [Pseudooceanicola pacificus]MWB79059.1 zinc-binding dehydrogenase [Pseudooceanicola pacificus]